MQSQRHIPVNRVRHALAAALVTLVAGVGATRAQSPAYTQAWGDTAITNRIERGIQTNRTGEAKIRVVDAQGKPVKNAQVQAVLQQHAFLFGSNIFMLNGFDTPEKNRRYEEVFASLFNYASAPFYWKDLEPQAGQVRFAANSPAIYRRPPPDAVLAFCQAHGITVKGHTLVWDHPKHGVPTWLPKDEKVVERLIRERINQIATRYGPNIPIWDVVNEVVKRQMEVPMPKDFAFNTFREAQRLFPASTQLLINETTQPWQDFRGEYSAYYLLIQNLLLRGAKIDGVGLQFHFFSEQLHQEVVAGKALDPKRLFDVLDTYDDFGKPIHITEITIPALPFNETGLANQAMLVRNFYRLWFSHPAVEAITWWNVADGTAVAGEDQWHGGFLDEKLSPKPAYQVLHDLINKEWKTDVRVKTNEAAEVSFRGFYGKYQITVQSKGKTVRQQVRLTKNGKNEFIITL